MTLPQDFLDDPAGFARINVLALYVLGGGLRKDGQKADVKYWGLTAAHAPNAVENKEHGKASPIPSFRARAEFAKQPAADQHFGEPLHQRQQPMFRHVRDQLVEHASLAEQRVCTRL